MENQNEQVIEADQDVNAFETLRPTSSVSRRSSHKGHDTMTAAFGGFEAEEHEADDRTPLLGRGSSDRDGNATDDAPRGEGNGNGASTWDAEHDFDGRPWWNKPSVFWLLPPFFLFTMAFGGVVVPRLDLIISLICRQYCSDRAIHDPTFHLAPVILGSNNPQCRTPEVQALVSKFQLYSSLIAGILSAITSPKLGALSDRYGRTKMISVSILGMLLSELTTILVAVYPDMFSVNWILFGFLFDGLGGSFIAAMALSYAYASDCTVPDRRNVVFGWYHGTLFAGIAFGPILAGYIVKASGKLLAPFYIAFSLHAAFLLFLLLVVPDSLTKERQLAARQKKKSLSDDSSNSGYASSWFSDITRILRTGNILAPLAVLYPTGPGTNPRVRRNLVLIAAVDTTMFGVAMGSMTVVLLYCKYMFGWDTFATTVFVSIVNTSRVITLLILLPLLSRLLRGPVSTRAKPKNSGSDRIDLGIIRSAILFDFLGYVGYTLVRTGPLFILCGALAAVGGMGSPTLQAALTKHAPPDKTGQVLGAMGLLHATARVVAPIVFNLTYAKTVGGFTQTVFVCLGATFGLAGVFSWFIRPYVYWDEAMPVSGDEPQSNDGVEPQDETTGKSIMLYSAVFSYSQYYAYDA
ncbi:hypothetical protein ACLMJK_002948 [Lecanora helva]